MTDFSHMQDERLSRQQVAQRLIDIAYTLTAGRPLDVRPSSRYSIPIAEHVRLVRALQLTEEEAVLELRMTWSTPAA